MSATQTEHHPDDQASFELEAGAIVQSLRAALAEVIGQFRPPVRRASHLRKLVKLSQKVCWGIFTAASAPDAVTIASLLPGRRGMERFFAAAISAGVPAETVDRARAAFERFESAVERHAGAGGRDAFETMAGEIGDRPVGGSAELKHKRSVFRGMSLLMGRQARTFCATYIARPSETPGLLDLVFIKGMCGLHRTRRAVPLHTTAHLWHTAHPGDPQVSPFSPLDPREGGPESIGLLRDFCSTPVPEFRLIESRPGYSGYELVSNTLGSAGEVTYFTGQTIRSACPVPRSIPGSELMMSKLIDIPLEVFVGDLFMHKSVWGELPPEVSVFTCRLDGSQEFRESDRLPLSERAECLGQGLYAARTSLVPRYEEVLSYAMDRIRCNPEEFRLFRCVVQYPVMHSRIRITFR